MSSAALIGQPMRKTPSSPWWRALACQSLGVGVAVGASAGWSVISGAGLTTPEWVLVQGAAAASIAAALRMPWWWIGLNFAFAPALALGVAASISPFWSAAALAALLLLFGGTQRTRVPLYLSSAAAVATLRELLPTDRPIALLDIGAGTGTVLSAICSSHPNVRARGIERAPLPFLIAFARAVAGGRKFGVSCGNFWSADLSAQDVVYAYLSPAPMMALWEKASREMRPGTMLVSFRFVIPGVVPTRMLPVGDDWLYVWLLT